MVDPNLGLYDWLEFGPLCFTVLKCVVSFWGFMVDSNLCLYGCLVISIVVSLEHESSGGPAIDILLNGYRKLSSLKRFGFYIRRFEVFWNPCCVSRGQLRKGPAWDISQWLQKNTPSRCFGRDLEALEVFWKSFRVSRGGSQEMPGPRYFSNRELTWIAITTKKGSAGTRNWTGRPPSTD